MSYDLDNLWPTLKQHWNALELAHYTQSEAVTKGHSAIMQSLHKAPEIKAFENY